MTAILVLGLISTVGLALVIYGARLARTGPVRGSIGVFFFTPIVATVLGVTVRHPVELAVRNPRPLPIAYSLGLSQRGPRRYWG